MSAIVAGTASRKMAPVPKPVQVCGRRVVPQARNPAPTVALDPTEVQGPTVVRARSVARSPRVALAMTVILALTEVRVQKVARVLTAAPARKVAPAMTVAPAVSEVVVVVEEAPSRAVMHLPVPPRRRDPVVRPPVRSGPLVHGLRW